MLYRAGKATGVKQGYHMINDTLHDGTAMAKFFAMLKAQGVCADVADRLCAKGADVMDILPKAKHRTELKIAYSGKSPNIDISFQGSIYGYI